MQSFKAQNVADRVYDNQGFCDGLKHYITGRVHNAERYVVLCKQYGVVLYIQKVLLFAAL